MSERRSNFSSAELSGAQNFLERLDERALRFCWNNFVKLTQILDILGKTWDKMAYSVKDAELSAVFFLSVSTSGKKPWATHALVILYWVKVLHSTPCGQQIPFFQRSSLSSSGCSGTRLPDYPTRKSTTRPDPNPELFKKFTTRPDPKPEAVPDGYPRVPKTYKKTTFHHNWMWAWPVFDRI